MEAIRAAESADAPSAATISQAEIDAALRWFRPNGRLSIYGVYQQNLSVKDTIAALKKEYGTHGQSYTFSDGTPGFIGYRPSAGITLQHYEPKAEITVKWSAVEKRIRQMIAEGSYLTPAELEKYQSSHLGQPPALEITDEDIAKLLTEDWGVAGRKQRIFALRCCHSAPAL